MLWPLLQEAVAHSRQREGWRDGRGGELDLEGQLGVTAHLRALDT